MILNANLMICCQITASNSNNTIWQTLSTADAIQLEQLAKNKTDTNSQGWLELAQITKNSARTGAYNNNKYMVAKITAWQQKYPNHPALSQFSELKQNIAPNFKNKSNQRIAILLPKTGDLSSAAQAITKGILTASYQDDNPNKPELIFIDTKNKPNDIVKHYNEALDKQADLIIGPLEKESVAILKEYTGNNKENSPTIIALNYLQNDNSPETSHNFYQIGISAEDEAAQAAVQSVNKNHKRSLLIIDNNEWGRRISKAYQAKLEQLDGKIVDTVFINGNHDTQNLVANINKSLGITQSQERKAKLKSIIKETLAFQPRHRQDIDNIFIITSSNQARQIKPMLKYFYADDIPIIATSQIYDYKTSNYDLLKDLDGVLFCDIPMLLHSRENKTAPSPSASEENKTDNLVRLYALGIDAYNLSYNINSLQALPNLGLLSNIGHLYLDKSGKIHRQLPWALIKNGDLSSEQNNWA